MITYRKTTPSIISYNRKLYEKKVHLKVNIPIFGSENARPSGYYFFILDNGQEVQLGEFKSNISYDFVRDYEDNNLQDFTNKRNIIDAILERTEQFMMVQLDLEHQENNDANWGINSSNIEKV